MVVGMVKDYFASPAWTAIVGIVGTLTGINHLFNPADALVADVFNMLAGFVGVAQGSGLIVTLSFLAGIGVTLAGIGVTLSALDM